MNCAVLVSEAERLKNENPETLREIVDSYSNRDALSGAMKTMLDRLGRLSETGDYLKPSEG